VFFVSAIHTCQGNSLIVLPDGILVKSLNLPKKKTDEKVQRLHSSLGDVKDSHKWGAVIAQRAVGRVLKNTSHFMAEEMETHVHTVDVSV
jgi:hypothetical protein